MIEKEWRFPDNNYGPEKGIDDGDVETFKSDPIPSLAREILQNSIDANRGEGPTIVEFNTFSIPRDDIPGITELTDQIEKCYEYQKHNPKEEKPLKSILDIIKRDNIKCLRISDFNTTGLEGVEDNSKDSPFYDLTKGSGVSNKFGSTGGSKGIGKNASFVVSSTNTVFYSTLTHDNHKGYIGISKLRSAPISDDGLVTQGIGYYSINNKNEPILEELNLDKEFVRNEPGTDIYLIGFVDNHLWKYNVIAEVLRSFLVSIIKKELIVKVKDSEINYLTIDDIINEGSFEKGIRKVDYKEIISQYQLLTEEEDIYEESIPILDMGDIKLYVKKYNRNNEKEASKRCVFIRYPYMRIKHETGAVQLPYSALCIIEDNKLNKALRDIENPQHTNWEINRLNSYPEEKSKMEKVLKEIKVKVREGIRSFIRETSKEEVDFEGAGEFFPSEEFGDVESDLIQKEKQVITQPKVIDPTSRKSLNELEPGTTTEFGDGDSEGDSKHIKEGGDESGPKGENGNPLINGQPNGENRGITKVRGAIVKIRNVAIDPDKGEYQLYFTAEKDVKNCIIEINQLGFGQEKNNISVLEASINESQLKINNGRITNLEIEQKREYSINYICDRPDLFTSEVNLYENRN